MGLPPQQGDPFFAGGEAGRRYFRMNFSNAAPELIREGVRRLGAALHTQLKAVQAQAGALKSTPTP